MPHRLCQVRGCPHEPVYRGRCESHSRKHLRASRSDSEKLYHTKRWRMLRKKRLFIEPLCRMCGAVAEQVDHIKPVEWGGSMWDLMNTQSLCHSCHSKKTNRENREVSVG